MRSRLALAAVLAIIAAACSPAASTPSPQPSETGPMPSAAASGPAAGQPVAVAREFLDALARRDTTAAEALEDATMRQAAPAASLGALWAQLEAQFGTFGSLGDATTTVAAPYTNVTVQATFEKAIVPLIVTVTTDGLVAGLHLGSPSPVGGPGSPTTSAPPSPSASPAAYVRPETFTETEVSVGAEPWTLPGTLSMPVGDGPFPAVVLLAGSGPNDRDETIGPNAPLRDIAWGLASNGIAVLRYDKRTRAHGAEMATDVENITVKEETVDDAVAAVDLLRATPGVDPKQVFVAGHSLGGYLAPRVAAAAPGKIAGIAMLEANSSPLPRLILDQVEYLASEAGGADPAAAAQLDAIRAQVATAESPMLSASTPPSKLPLGVPAAYWLDLRTYDPTATAAALPIPMFIAQGGRDYQVPPSELPAWRRALAGRTDVTIKEYPALDHLLLAGSGPSRPAEYAVAGHVAAEVIADLVTWVRGG